MNATPSAKAQAGGAAVAVRRWHGEAAIVLAAGDVEAVFLPELGMLGSSLRYRGEEYLSFHGGLAAPRSGRTNALPLLAPWANRLSTRRFHAAGVDVDLDGVALIDDGRGQPIHGTMLARPEWEILRLNAAGRTATVRARFDYGAHEDLLSAFPFPHVFLVDAALDERSLRVRVTLLATGDRRVPVSFGWHPYFRLPGSSRRSWTLLMPTTDHMELDARGIPTGRSTHERRRTTSLADVSLDDLFALGTDRRFELAGDGRRLGVRFDAGYPFAQIYAPEGAQFCAIEPMTAPTDALVTGRCPAVPPGDRFRATFRVTPA